MTKIAAFAFAFALSLAALARLGAQPAAQPVASSPAFRVLHYDLTSEIVPSTRSLTATAAVTLESLNDEVRTVRLYLHREFTVRQVRAGDQVLRHAQPQDKNDTLMFSPEAVPLDIELGRGLRKAERVIVSVDYGGPISHTINGVNMITPELTELAGYAAWYPLQKQNPSFTYELRVTLPADHAIVVTDGREVTPPASDTTRTRVFRRDDASFDIPFVTGASLKMRDRRVGAAVARVVFRDLDESAALASLDGAIRCGQELTRLFGPPTATGAVTVVFSPRPGWGYSRAPLIIGPEQSLGDMLKTAAGRQQNFRGLAHEAAHFWWNLAPSDTSNDWLNESLAEYFTLRVVEQALDPAAVADEWREQFRAANSVPADKTMLGTVRSDQSAYALFYQRGSSIFRTLESRMGRADLDRLLARFYQKHRGRRDATTASFLVCVREQAGSRFDAYFDRMLTRGGLPGVRLTWTAGTKQVSGTVALDDAGLVGFPLSLHFQGKSRAEVVRKAVTLQAGETRWQFSLPFDVAMVMLDPDSWTLRADPAARFAYALVPLVHGPNMDALPQKIPTANLAKARALLEEWGALEPGSAALAFERAWLALVEKRPTDAVTHLTAAVPALDFVSRRMRPSVYSVLGRSYDLLGERDNALTAYRQGLRLAAELGAPATQQMMMFHNFLEVPYPRGLCLHFVASTGELELVNELLRDSPALINSRDPYLGLTPIVWVAQGRARRPMIERLVEAGADLNVRDEKGRTLLEVVRLRGNAELVDYLVSKGAK